ncbi:MAG: hypothetical protein M1337_02655 [Actinobacteria bacterium]|nr:hypothetical protein [Actinomycetota bacterium]
MGDISGWYFLGAALMWVLLILRWRYGRKSARRAAMLNVTGGYLRDKTSRGGF